MPVTTAEESAKVEALAAAQEVLAVANINPSQALDFMRIKLMAFYHRGAIDALDTLSGKHR